MQLPFLIFGARQYSRFLLFQNTLRASNSLAYRLQVLVALHCIAFAMS